MRSPHTLLLRSARRTGAARRFGWTTTMDAPDSKGVLICVRVLIICDEPQTPKYASGHASSSFHSLSSSVYSKQLRLSVRIALWSSGTSEHAAATHQPVWRRSRDDEGAETNADKSPT